VKYLSNQWADDLVNKAEGDFVVRESED